MPDQKPKCWSCGEAECGKPRYDENGRRYRESICDKCAKAFRKSGWPMVEDSPANDIVKKLIQEATTSMENGDGHRSGLYLRAAWQLLNGQSGTELEVCLEGIDKDENA